MVAATRVPSSSTRRSRKYPFRFHPTDREWGLENTQLDVHPEIFPAEVTGFVAEIPGYGQPVVGNVLDMQSTGLKHTFVFPILFCDNYILVNQKSTVLALRFTCRHVRQHDADQRDPARRIFLPDA